jgi:hypothetical protein
LALGATRTPPDKDEVFGLGDRPWGQDGPGGLGITVRRSIDDDETRRALEARLSDATSTTRWAAATALRHSTAAPDVREAFERSLALETDDAPAAVVGETLAAVARRADAPDRDRVLRLLVARAGLDGMDGLRFRVIDDLAGAALPAEVRATLAAYAELPHPFGLRSFALEVLAGAASVDDAARRDVRALLARFLRVDADAAIRDVAARMLRKTGTDAVAADALLRAVREDAAWNVRYAALDSLVAVASPDAVAALAAASHDSDERVRTLAARLSDAK